MNPLLLDELAATQVEVLRRQAARERLALPLLPSSRLARAGRRSLQAFGFLLVGVGLRLAMAGERQAPARRSLA